MTRTPAENDLAYWKGRANELEAVLRDLRLRFLALARSLPVELLPALEKNAEALDSEFPSRALFDSGEETAQLSSSNVETEMRALWARLDLPEGR